MPGHSTFWFGNGCVRCGLRLGQQAARSGAGVGKVSFLNEELRRHG